MARPSLTAQQQAEVERLLHLLREKTDQDLRELAELLVRKEDGELFGATEFEVRDLVHGIGAKALATTLAERKKRGTTAPAASARTAASRQVPALASEDLGECGGTAAGGARLLLLPPLSRRPLSLG